jgi:hypothetical protein
MRSYVCVCVVSDHLCVSGGDMERKSILATPIVVDKFLSATSFLFLFSHRHCREKNLLPGESPFSFFLSRSPD